MKTRSVLILALAFIAGCGGGGGGGPPPWLSRFVYGNASGAPNTVPTDIYGFAVYSNGELTQVPGFPAPAQDGGGGPLAISHDSKLLYTTQLINLVVAFQINAEGSLSDAPSPSFIPPDA